MGGNVPEPQSWGVIPLSNGMSEWHKGSLSNQDYTQYTITPNGG